jgi:hypothetical protein
MLGRVVLKHVETHFCGKVKVGALRVTGVRDVASR